MIQLIHARICLASDDQEGAEAVLQRARRELWAKADWIQDEAARRRFLEQVESNAELLALAGADPPGGA